MQQPWRHPLAAPAGTALVYLIGWSADPLSDDFDEVIGFMRDDAHMAQFAAKCGINASAAELSSVGFYLRGEAEPYVECPPVEALYAITVDLPDVDGPRRWSPLSQFAFVDRESAEAEAKHMTAEFGVTNISVRPLLLESCS